jgi:hypothetical protein
MMGDEPKQTALAFVCVCGLVAVAFFAAYSGQIYASAGSTSHFSLGIATVVIGFVQAVAASITFIVIAFVAINQLRAYVYPGQILVNFYNFAHPMVVTIDIRNSGATPAKNAETIGSVFVEKIPLDDNFIIRTSTEQSSARHSVLPLYPRNTEYCFVYSKFCD